MDTEFNNDILHTALVRMREDNSNENVIKAVQALIDTKVMIPARWDKKPMMDEATGKLIFSPDTKVTPIVVTNEAGVKFFPFFTSVEEVKKMYKDRDENVNCLIMGLKQYLPMLQNAKGEISGIVMDPAGVDVPFPTDFIEGCVKAYRSPLRQQAIGPGQSVFLRDPEGNLQDMEAALISSGFHEPAINAIYLKERLNPQSNPENPESTWFILVDVDPENKDTGIFTRISGIIKPIAGDKDIEFMFGDTKLGRDIKNTSKPIYTRMVF